MQNPAALDFFDACNDVSGESEDATLLRKFMLKPGGAVVRKVFKQANALKSVVFHVTEIGERLRRRLLVDRLRVRKNGES